MPDQRGSLHPIIARLGPAIAAAVFTSDRAGLAPHATVPAASGARRDCPLALRARALARPSSLAGVVVDEAEDFKELVECDLARGVTIHHLDEALAHLVRDLVVVVEPSVQLVAAARELRVRDCALSVFVEEVEDRLWLQDRPASDGHERNATAGMGMERTLCDGRVVVALVLWMYQMWRWQGDGPPLMMMRHARFGQLNLRLNLRLNSTSSLYTSSHSAPTAPPRATADWRKARRRPAGRARRSRRWRTRHHPRRCRPRTTRRCGRRLRER